MSTGQQHVEAPGTAASESCADPSSSQPPRQRKRRQRACDICRHKKIKCDGYQMPGRLCSPCKAQHNSCTYRNTGQDTETVHDLQAKLRKMEKMMAELSPTTAGQHAVDDSIPLRHPSDPILAPPGRTYPSDVSDDESEDEGDPTGRAQSWPEIIDTRMQDLASSFARFYIEDKLRKGGPLLHSHDLGANPGKGAVHTRLSFKRLEFWDTDWWEGAMPRVQPRTYFFPPPDLLSALVALYFAHVNAFHPILHRPTFARRLTSGVHFSDRAFGSVVLLVCALGARFSDDPRVFCHHVRGTAVKYAKGWQWFTQVTVVDDYRLAQLVTLEELQAHCLALYYAHLCAMPLFCWSLAGLCIRRAQDVGIHRRRTRRNSVDDELWRRAFWFLVVADRYVSSALGRPCAIQDEDFDLALPADCDDEYWENVDPTQWFKQPAEVPSAASYFSCFIRIQRLAGIAAQTLYSTQKKIYLTRFLDAGWEQKVVTELDSELNSWRDSIPAHLLWDPANPNPLFFAQSAVLHATYYHIQILVHRPFISPARRNASLALPSLVICTNAARAGTQVIAAYRQRSGELLPWIHIPLFTYATILLLNVWASRRMPGPRAGVDPQRDLELVRTCMACLAADEGRWVVAGRLNDILNELLRVVEHAPTTALHENSVIPPSSDVSRDAPPDHGSLNGYREPLGTSQDLSGTIAATPVFPFAHMPQHLATSSFAGDAANHLQNPGAQSQCSDTNFNRYFAPGQEQIEGQMDWTGLQLPEIDWSGMQGFSMPLEADGMATWDNAPATGFGLGQLFAYLSNGMVYEGGDAS